jgi:hypothetical protein
MGFKAAFRRLLNCKYDLCLAHVVIVSLEEQGDGWDKIKSQKNNRGLIAQTAIILVDVLSRNRLSCLSLSGSRVSHG